MISCSQAVAQLREYLDGCVDETDRMLVEEQLPEDVLGRLNRTLEKLEHE